MAAETLMHGIQLVGALGIEPDLDDPRSDDAWTALKRGVVVARKHQEELDKFSTREMQLVLCFLAKTAKKRRTTKAQVLECLAILLARRPWLSAATSNASLQAALQDVLADKDELLQLLLEGPSALLEVTKATQAPEAKIVMSQAAASKLSSSREQLLQGCRVMEKFGWRFPCDPLSNRMDDATEGFQSFCEGVTGLSNASGKICTRNEIALVLAELDPKWHNVLEFLLGMYTSGIRCTYAARIKFVVVKLRYFSRQFQNLKSWRDLPWSDEPMPEEEAKTEAYERWTQSCREEADFRLAWEMQAREVARFEAEEAAHARGGA
eukprot:TRINITY_DN33944_c0_g1_i1.p1 TRINITY_DN33944_c0_g1~~TRINITY_DN33944_c0_g1_i1.p1  ORF type:complete len:323 (+),score=72.05 TRINITY_DN33944_c0_g1_i1:72-1040(+)